MESLVYSEENGVLLLIFTKFEGKGKLEQGKMFTYGRLCNVDYEDSELSNLFLHVQTMTGLRRVVVDENNIVLECCSPKVLRKDIQTKEADSCTGRDTAKEVLQVESRKYQVPKTTQT